MCLLVLLFPSYGRLSGVPNALFNEGRTFVLEVELMNRFAQYADEKAASDGPTYQLERMASILLSPFSRPPGLIVFDNARTLLELLGIALATGLGFVAVRIEKDA
jgi:hypothetical protein